MSNQYTTIQYIDTHSIFSVLLALSLLYMIIGVYLNKLSLFSTISGVCCVISAYIGSTLRLSFILKTNSFYKIDFNISLLIFIITCILIVISIILMKLEL
jgi:hypothetical protein